LTPQIQFGDLEQLVRSKIVHFGDHGKLFRPIIDILMISSLEQLIHSLRTRHLTETQQHSMNTTLLHTQFFKSKTDAKKIDQNLNFYNSILTLENKTDVVRITQRVQIALPQRSVSMVQWWMKQ
jgi:hypothetical protein